MSDPLSRDLEDINYNLPEETELPPEAEIDDRDFIEGEDTKVDLEKVITEQEYDGE